MIGINDQFSLDLASELIVDNFAGGGGASDGIHAGTGRHVDIAANHDPEALGMHHMNHPQTLHLLEDVFKVDPRKVTKGRPVGLAWFSPDCKHFSKAKGGKPVDKKIRGLALVMINWVATVRPRVLMMENVEEIQTWGPLLPNGRPDPRWKGRTWRALLDILGNGIAPDHPDLPDILEVVGDVVTKEQLCVGFGYVTDGRELRACDYGAPTIRKRYFMIARCDGRPIVWPAPTHAAPGSGSKLPAYRTAAECIDFSIFCPSIFLSKASAKRYGCKRPLVRASMARIAKGVDRYVLKTGKPYIISVTHQGGDRVESLGEPFRTVTGANRGEKALVAPYFVPRYGERKGQEPRTMPVTQPMPVVVPTGNGATLVAPVLAHAQHGGRVRPANAPHHTIAASTKDQNQVLAVHLTKFNTGSVGSGADEPVPTVPACSHKPETRGGAATPHGLVAATLVKMSGAPETHAPGHLPTEPLHTVRAGGQHHSVTAVYLAQHNGGANGHQTIGHAPTSPVSTVSSKGSQQNVVAAALVKYNGTDQDPRADEPLHSVTTKDRFGALTAECVAPLLTLEQLAGAKMVADFLRAFGVEFEGEFATVVVDGVTFVIVDIGMRMLTPRELFRAQGFQEGYIIDRAIITRLDGTRFEKALSKEAQIRMCGNSVCPPVSCALVRANLPELILKRAPAGRRRAVRTSERTQKLAA